MIINKLDQFLSCSLLIFLSILSNYSIAESVEYLIKNKELSIKATLVASDEIVAKQPVTLIIQVATNRWFAKGTNIHDIDLTEAVILPNSELTINGTERINGVTWVVQTHEIVMYPMQVGVYKLEPVLVDVFINTENDGIISGTIQTKPLQFETSKPTELDSIDHYIVTPKLSIAIESSFDEVKEYQIGEAITETVTIKVEDVPSMMILPLAKSKLDGVSIYQKPVKVFDKNVRGIITGTREESTTYIFETAGEYQIPQQTLYWWNSLTEQLESETLPARTWVIASNEVAIERSSGITPFWPLSSNLIAKLLMVLFLSFFVWQSYRHKNWLINYFNKMTNKRLRDCKNNYLTAIQKQQWQVACQQLYLFIYANNISQRTDKQLYPERDLICLKDYFSDDIEKLLLVKKLLKAAYQKNDEKLTIAEAKKLIKKKQKIKLTLRLFYDAKKINLNPINKDI